MAEGVEVAPSSIADLRRLGDAYKGGDKVLQKRLRSGLQAAAKPLAESVVKEGGAEMPARGGLRARLQGAKGAVTASLAGRNVAVSIRIANREKDSLSALNTGLLRHPVFRTGAWVAQTVPAGQYDEAFRRGEPDATKRVNAEIQAGLAEIAREA